MFHSGNTMNASVTCGIGSFCNLFFYLVVIFDIRSTNHLRHKRRKPYYYYHSNSQSRRFIWNQMISETETFHTFFSIPCSSHIHWKEPYTSSSFQFNNNNNNNNNWGWRKKISCMSSLWARGGIHIISQYRIQIGIWVPISQMEKVELLWRVPSTNRNSQFK